MQAPPGQLPGPRGFLAPVERSRHAKYRPPAAQADVVAAIGPEHPTARVESENPP